MFTNIVTIDKFMWAPFQGMIFDDDEVGDGIKNATNDDVNIEKGNRDSGEDNLPNLIDDINNMVACVNVSNNSSNHSSSGKRKAPQHCPKKSVQKRKVLE
jgi:hypothetical protein